MKRALSAPLAICLALAGPAAAQIATPATLQIAQPQAIEWREGKTIALRTARGRQTTILPASGERIMGVNLGSDRDFRTEISPSGDRVTIMPMTDRSSTSMTIITDRRAYRFDLKPARNRASQRLVQLVVSAAAPQPSAFVPADQPTSKWQMRGDRRLRPSELSDDGTRTYLSWSAGQSLPAVFAIGATGEEEVVDGYMRGGVFTIDRVPATLVFRIDDAKASATRSEPKR